MAQISLIAIDPELIIERDSLEQELRETWEERDICVAAKLRCAENAKHASRPDHLYKKDITLERIANERMLKAEGKISDLVYCRDFVRTQIKEESREIANAFAEGESIDYILNTIAYQPRGNRRLWSMVRHLKLMKSKYGDAYIRLREKVKSVLLKLPEGYYQQDRLSPKNAKARELQFRMSRLSEMSNELTLFNEKLKDDPENQDKLEQEYQNYFSETVSKFGK